ncbi:MAG: hypothetical protein IJ807_04630 [Eubacterium sp.]|nr:hypothetical protein [Eubacterium sp.]
MASMATPTSANTAAQSQDGQLHAQGKYDVFFYDPDCLSGDPNHFSYLLQIVIHDDDIRRLNHVQYFLRMQASDGILYMV